MKIILPTMILLAVALGCVAPKSGRTRTESQPDDQPTYRPTMEYTSPKWSNEHDVYYLLTFEVRNTSNVPLEFVQIHASFYDKDGGLIRSEEPYIDRYEHLGPGQRSAAQVQVTPDRRIKNVKLEFTCHGEESFSTADIAATEVPKIVDNQPIRPK